MVRVIKHVELIQNTITNRKENFAFNVISNELEEDKQEIDDMIG